jgi:hypothetical protein
MYRSLYCSLCSVFKEPTPPCLRRPEGRPEGAKSESTNWGRFVNPQIVAQPARLAPSASSRRVVNGKAEASPRIAYAVNRSRSPENLRRGTALRRLAPALARGRFGRTVDATSQNRRLPLRIPGARNGVRTGSPPPCRLPATSRWELAAYRRRGRPRALHASDVYRVGLSKMRRRFRLAAPRCRHQEDGV